MTAESILLLRLSLGCGFVMANLQSAKEKMVAAHPGQPVKNSGAAMSNSMPRRAIVDAARAWQCDITVLVWEGSMQDMAVCFALGPGPAWCGRANVRE